jgi:hypothetical protein
MTDRLTWLLELQDEGVEPASNVPVDGDTLWPLEERMEAFSSRSPLAAREGMAANPDPGFANPHSHTGTGPLQAWGIEVEGRFHGVMFVCETHAVDVAARSQVQGLADGSRQRMVRLRHLDGVAELLGDRSACFACRLGGPARPAPHGLPNRNPNEEN